MSEMSGPRKRRVTRPMTTDAYPTEVSVEDLTRIGEVLLNAAAGMAVLGHESPAGMADYVERDDLPSWHAQFVLDMVALSQGIGQDERKNEALDRIYGFAWQTGWADRGAEAAGRIG